MALLSPTAVVTLPPPPTVTHGLPEWIKMNARLLREAAQLWLGTPDHGRLDGPWWALAAAARFVNGRIVKCGSGCLVKGFAQNRRLAP